MITFYVISLCAKVMGRIAGVSASRTSRVAAWMNMNAALPAPTKVSLEVGSIMLYATSGKEPSHIEVCFECVPLWEAGM